MGFSPIAVFGLPVNPSTEDPFLFLSGLLERLDTAGSRVETLQIELFAGAYPSRSYPVRARSHRDVYRFHRKWEQRLPQFEGRCQ